MSYREADLTADFAKYRRKHKEAQQLLFTCAIEFKVKHNKESLHLIRDFQPQQIPKLIEASTGCVYHKISDMGVGLKPFDAFQICFAKAFVAVCWQVPRVQKILYLIPVAHIQTRIDANQLLLKEHEARELAEHIIDLMGI